MTKPTQPPWDITTDLVRVVDTGGRTLASLDSKAAPDFDLSVSIANAKIMASAHEMMSALKGVMTDIDSMSILTANASALINRLKEINSIASLTLQCIERKGGA